MERRNKYLKVLAFVPAIVLVGGFVGCRAGVFNFAKPKPEPTVAPQQPQPTAPEPAPEKEPTFMPGSKSINLKGVTIGLTPAGTYAPDIDVPIRQPVPPEKKPPVFLPGSKSDAGLSPPSLFGPPQP